MSYTLPSVLVYQQLNNPGGVSMTTPDLEACIIGPLNNVVTYTPDSIPSAVKTAAVSVSVSSCTTTAGSNKLTDVSTPGLFAIDDVVIVVGAGTSGANLQATITGIAGTVITLDTATVLSVTDTTFHLPGSVSNINSDTQLGVASSYAGQIVDSKSVKVYLNAAKVKTVSTKAYGYASNTLLTFSSGAVATAGSTTAGATSVVLASTGPNTINMLAVGDSISIPGAGTSSGAYTGTITAINSGTSTLTVTPATATTVPTGTLVSKVATANVNSTTNTLRLESGDKIRITYTNTSSVVKKVTTTANTVLTTSKNNGNLTSVVVTDMLPSDMSFVTTTSGSANTSGATALNVVLGSGFSIGDHLKITGGGAGAADLVTSVTAVTGNVLTIADALGTTLAAGAEVVRAPHFTLDVIKTYNNQLLPATKPISGGSQIDLSDVALNNKVVIGIAPELVYGPLVNYTDSISLEVIPAANVYIGYTALRTDQSQTVLSVESAKDAEGQFGDLTDANPLGLGVLIALANTTTRVRAISVPSNDLEGYLTALELSQGERLYFLAPLTQDPSILSAFQAHVNQMSVPAMASWRVALINTAIPTSKNVGSYTKDVLNANGGNNSVTNISGFWTLTSSNSTFMSDGVVASDSVNIYENGAFASYTVASVVSNQQLVLSGVTAVKSSVNFYISRSLTKTQQASAVAATSTQFNDKRIIHIQPDYVGITINSVVKKLPGYYLCCGVAGMGAGFAVQQGFTNISIAGVSSLYNSNYYFARSDLNAMAAAGTFLFVQSTQAGIPYCRHEMTTDISVLEYRELLVVKNWDFLSYYYHDKLRSFIGSWNITPDTINIIRQTIVASSELLITQKLPKIGPPLLGYTVGSIAQDKNNKDNLNVTLNIEVVYPLNYLNLYLVI